MEHSDHPHDLDGSSYDYGFLYSHETSMMERPPSSTIPTAFSVSDWPAPDLSISSLPSYEVVEDIHYTELSPEAGYYLPYSQLTGDLPFGQYYDFGDPIPGNSTRQPLNDDAVDLAASQLGHLPISPVSQDASSYQNLPGPTTKQTYECLAPGCSQKSFSRSADLDRHYKQVHIPEDEKRKYRCDYKKCLRHEAPFGRLDHLKEHLRDFHKEDLISRPKRQDAQWWESRAPRAVFNGWWRCNRCLVVRVDIETDGYTCPACGDPCESDRVRVREAAAGMSQPR
ncbi:uncharacterized protein PODANS_6_6250 [Podospora anserina S mat+]|uniref:Podospora anserina S mat+ genomic DNA chromosome 6, supercontig 2 n=1 Tax=Podospora anserina (strain S / ATCC MYA-4624 / DSM 980 / FGSC 10383) TaxID=515849 RepID=B2B3H8_PODAN|nr:uncharacterized protein PODANS_6_6250 [Podospora anserina S mat+]CAP71664.1 unnamed protein product [Podospora anserina S mat+]CDP31057.1 Putative protein of unknown function [Podospora anserina S mat+]